MFPPRSPYCLSIDFFPFLQLTVPISSKIGLLFLLAHRIRPIKHTVLNKRTPLFFADFGGPAAASAKDRLLILNFPPEVTQTGYTNV